MRTIVESKQFISAELTHDDCDSEGRQRAQEPVGSGVPGLLYIGGQDKTEIGQLTASKTINTYRSRILENA